MDTMLSALGATLPIVAAPMAGGPTTVALAASVASAGGFPILAAGYKAPDAVADEIRQVEAAGANVGMTGFGVNLFVPSASGVDAAAFRTYAAELQPEADAYGLQLDPTPVADDDFWEDKLDLLTMHPVPVVSFTFGLPAPGQIAALRRAGSIVLASITTPAEAIAAREAGVSGLLVQGPDAGGHSATFDPDRPIARMGTAELVGRVRAVVDLPLVAAGGVNGAGAVAALVAAGAEAVAVGTLLLRTDEAGTSTTHRAALADPRFDRTALTHAFTGRPARALRNGFMARHDGAAPFGYPAVHHLTRELRRAAAQAGDADRVHLWAGTGYRSAPTGPAADVIRGLVGDLLR